MDSRLGDRVRVRVTIPKVHKLHIGKVIQVSSRRLPIDALRRARISRPLVVGPSSREVNEVSQPPDSRYLVHQDTAVRLKSRRSHLASRDLPESSERCSSLSPRRLLITALAELT